MHAYQMTMYSLTQTNISEARTVSTALLWTVIFEVKMFFFFFEKETSSPLIFNS